MGVYVLINSRVCKLLLMNLYFKRAIELEGVCGGLLIINCGNYEEKIIVIFCWSGINVLFFMCQKIYN